MGRKKKVEVLPKIISDLPMILASPDPDFKTTAYAKREIARLIAHNYDLIGMDPHIEVKNKTLTQLIRVVESLETTFLNEERHIRERLDNLATKALLEEGKKNADPA